MKIAFFGRCKVGRDILEPLSQNYDIVFASCMSKEQDQVYTFCEQNKIPVIVFDPKCTSSKEKLADMICDVDILIVCNFVFVPTEIYTRVKHLAVNIHYSLLPYHRGSNPIASVLEKGDTFTGVTIHRLTDIIDGGEILVQKKVPVHANDSFISLYEKLKEKAVECIHDLID